MNYSISQIANLLGISVRTLHYYDEIEIVKPVFVTDAGYRYYDDNSISTLQQILFYRELEFSLKEIKLILCDPKYDKTQTLKNHKDLLIIKRNHINSLIDLVNSTLGGTDMAKNQTTYEDIEKAKAKYSKEVKSRWGTTDEYKQYKEKKRKQPKKHNFSKLMKLTKYSRNSQILSIRTLQINKSRV